MNGPSSLPGASDGAGPGETAAHPAPGQGGLCGTLALSLGHRTITVELNVARSEADGIRFRDPGSRHLWSIEDDRGRPRWPRPAWRARKDRRARCDAPPPSPEVPAPMYDPGKQQTSRSRTPINFWDALSPPERHTFRTLAEERTFASGARLMSGGETGNYVIVILSGWTKICAYPDGTERVIAERGPGQLVGERAALQVSVRSATVVALEKVRALVVKTEDFATFVSAHPAVLEIVESQVYERLTEDPASGPRHDGPPVPAPAPPDLVVSGRQPQEGIPGHRPQPLNGENCTVVITDVAEFGALTRTGDDRWIIRRAILEMTHLALDGIWDECSREDRGDGLLIVVPPNIPTAKVLEHLRTMLPVTLRRHNRTYAVSARIQLRVAVDVGPIVSDDMGVSGDAIIRAARMRDAPVLKTAMTGNGATLGVIVSEFVYEAAVRQGSDLIDAAGYRKVSVSVKETVSLPAWMELVVPSHLSALTSPLAQSSMAT